MLKMLKDNFKVTNDCIILATPMVLYFIFTQWYVHTFQMSILSDFTSKELIFSTNYVVFFVTLWVWMSGCFSGWFYMTKKTLQFSGKTFLFDNDRNSALVNLLYCLIKGVGKFFISFLVILALFLIFVIADIEILLYLFYNSISGINFFMINTIFVLLISFFFLYVVPEIVYSYSNPLSAVINSVKKACISFKHLFPVYVLLVLAGLILKFLFMFSINFPLLYFFLLIFSYYYVLYSVIIIFRIYERDFVE